MGADTRQAATFQCDLSGSPRVLGDLEVSPTERPRGVRTEHLGQHASALPTGHAAERCVCAGGTICFHPSATGAGRKWSPARGGGLRQGPRSGPMTAARAGTAWGEAERPAQSRRSSYAASAEGVGTAAPKRERPTAALRPLSSMAPPSLRCWLASGALCDGISSIRPALGKMGDAEKQKVIRQSSERDGRAEPEQAKPLQLQFPIFVD